MSVLCPDPWPEHPERRVVARALVAGVAARLAPAGELIVASPARGVVEAARDLAAGCALRPSAARAVDADGFLRAHPLGVLSEDEEAAEAAGARVFRVAFERVHGV